MKKLSIIPVCLLIASCADTGATGGAGLQIHASHIANEHPDALSDFKSESKNGGFGSSAYESEDATDSEIILHAPWHHHSAQDAQRTALALCETNRESGNTACRLAFSFNAPSSQNINGTSVSAGAWKYFQNTTSNLENKHTALAIADELGTWGGAERESKEDAIAGALGWCENARQKNQDDSAKLGIPFSECRIIYSR